SPSTVTVRPASKFCSPKHCGPERACHLSNDPRSRGAHVTAEFRMRIVSPVMLLSLAGICGGQTAQYTARPIRSVEYSNPGGLRRADLERVQVLNPGKIFRPEDAAEAIDSLFATGRFEDIAIEAEPLGDGIALRFVTEPARFISGYTIAGNPSQPPNRGEITSAAQMQLGARFRQEDVESAVDRI